MGTILITRITCFRQRISIVGVSVTWWRDCAYCFLQDAERA